MKVRINENSQPKRNRKEEMLQRCRESIDSIELSTIDILGDDLSLPLKSCGFSQLKNIFKIPLKELEDKLGGQEAFSFSSYKSISSEESYKILESGNWQLSVRIEAIIEGIEMRLEFTQYHDHNGSVDYMNLDVANDFYQVDFNNTFIGALNMEPEKVFDLICTIGAERDEFI